MNFTHPPRRRQVRQTRFMSRSRYDVLIGHADFIAMNGYSPSVRELAEIMGKRSHSSIHSHIDRLTQDGFLFRRPGRARSCRLTKDAVLILPRNRQVA